MATLTCKTLTRSTVIASASRLRLTMPLSRALETIVVSGAVEAESTRYAVSTLSAPSMLVGPSNLSVPSTGSNPSFATGAVRGNNHKSITNDAAALLDSRKPCGAVDDQGSGMSRKGAFVISLGSRPPSPPVL